MNRTITAQEFAADLISDVIENGSTEGDAVVDVYSRLTGNCFDFGSKFEALTERAQIQLKRKAADFVRRTYGKLYRLA